AGNSRFLFRDLNTMINRLGVKNDPRRIKVAVSLDPNPNASVLVGPGDMNLTIGLIAMTRTMDDLAATIAHEMTHNNSDFDIQLPGGAEDVDKLIDQLRQGRNIDFTQREEIRADLGAVERMIRGGYN